MAETAKNPINNFRIRAALPDATRYVVIALLGISVIALVVAFYRGRSTSSFKVRSEHAQLSTDVIANVNGYERLETIGDVPKFFIRADNAVTFSDNHQELTNVFVRLYDDAGNEADALAAGRALYIPAPEGNFIAYLKDNVNIDTKDGVNIKTGNLTFTKAVNTAESDELIEFAKDGVKGRAFGAVLNIGEKKLDLLRDVEIETVAANGEYSKATSSSAKYDHIEGRFDLVSNVVVHLKSKQNDLTDVTAGKATVFLDRSEGEDSKSTEVKKLELVENVNIVSKKPSGTQSNISAGYALYTKPDDRYELRESARIVSGGADVRAERIVYEPTALKARLDSNVSVVQGGDTVTGDVIDAFMFADGSIKAVRVDGNANVKQINADRTLTVSAPKINADWNDAHVISNATTLGQTTAIMAPNNPGEYSLVTTTAVRSLSVTFAGAGLIRQMTTDGRTKIKIDGNSAQTDASNKTVTADAVKTDFYADGKNIRRTEAIGDAELFIEPLKGGANKYQTTINAARFDCDFYATDNAAKLCVGTTKTKTVRTPMFEMADRGVQTILSDKLSASFREDSKDMEFLEASGNAKFNELERNAIANQMSYTEGDGVIRLRGGEPTAWDSLSRAKAREIDYLSREQRSAFRGKVSTTYYTKKTTGNSVPFGESEKPVFVTSDTADIDHKTEIAVFTGTARGWQGDNFVRADKLTLFQRDGKFRGDGNVQSTIYDSKQTQNGKEVNVPVFATAGTMDYDRDTRILRYRTKVDLRQGTDRMTSDSADIYLNENNKVIKTVNETSVVVTQPGRKATGEWMQYTAENEQAILRGNPATVTDAQNGSSRSTEITMFMKENRFVGSGKTRQNQNGRVKSVYNVKPTQ